MATCQGPLIGSEAALAECMSPARRAQFAAGRALARAALAELGVEAGALPRATGGAPDWPAGCVGSITHCGEGADSWAAVAVARGNARRALGLDAERERPVSPAVRARILRPAELAALGGEATWLPTLFFSAKESAYKALYPLTGRLLDFQDVEIALGAGTFEARVLVRHWPPGAPAVLAGRWRRGDGRIVTAIELPPAA